MPISHYDFLNIDRGLKLPYCPEYVEASKKLYDAIDEMAKDLEELRPSIATMLGSAMEEHDYTALRDLSATAVRADDAVKRCLPGNSGATISERWKSFDDACHNMAALLRTLEKCSQKAPPTEDAQP